MQTKTVDLLGRFFMQLTFVQLAMTLGALLSGDNFFFIKVTLAFAFIFFLLSLTCAHVAVKRRQP